MDDLGVTLAGHPRRGDVVRITKWGAETEPVRLVCCIHEAPLGARAGLERWLAETDDGTQVRVLVGAREPGA